MSVSRREVGIYGHRKSGVWLVQAMCPHPLGGDAEIGEPTRVEPHQIDTVIADVVLENLRHYHRTNWNEAAGRKYDRQFIREHDLVEVAMLPEGTIEIIPAQHERGGYHGTRANMVVLSPTEMRDRLPSVLREAFRVARG